MDTHRGFTLIELMVVILVIAVIIGMLLAGVGPLREGIKRSKTATILGMARSALEARSAEMGGSQTVVPHLFANVRADVGLGMERTDFVRGDGPFTAGTAVSPSGLALIAAVPGAVDAAEAGRIILPSDRFRGVSVSGDAPQFYGLPRYVMGVLGSGAGWMEALRLPNIEDNPWADANGNGVIDGPYDFTRFRGQRYRIGDIATDVTTAPELESAQAFSVMFGDSTRAELDKLSAIVVNESGDLLAGSRVRRRAEYDSNTVWRPGMVRDGGSFVTYNLRGTSLVDAWGNEVLAFTNENGVLVMISGGRDGAFRFHPGSDGILQTAAHSDVSSGDDRDARSDNVLDGAKSW